MNAWRWSFSTNAFTGHRLERALEEIAAAGYRGVELLADRPHLVPGRVSSRQTTRLAALLLRLGLRPASLNANTVNHYYGRDFWEPLFEPSLANPQRTVRRWRFEQLRRCLAIARDLGCDHVSVTSGRPLPGTAPERSLALLSDSLQELAAHCAATGVRLGIEYEPGLLVENATELAALLDRLDSPWIGANLDLSHCQVLGEELPQVLQRLGGRIFHLHLADIRGRKHYHLLPGQGTMDIAGALELLAAHGYRGYLTVELYTCCRRPAKAARVAFAHLQGLGRREERSLTCASSNRTSTPWPAPPTTT